MTGLLRHLLVVHAADVVVTVVAAAGYQHRAASLAPVVRAHHLVGRGAGLNVCVEEVSLAALHPHRVQIYYRGHGPAIEVATAGSLVGHKRWLCRFGTNACLGVGRALDRVRLHTSAGLHIEVLTLLGGDA